MLLERMAGRVKETTAAVWCEEESSYLWFISRVTRIFYTNFYSHYFFLLLRKMYYESTLLIL